MEMKINQESLRGGLQVLVVVVRGDGVVVKQVPWSTAVSRLIGSFLNKLPKKWFGQNRRDERLATHLHQAGVQEKERYLSVGLNPSIWSQWYDGR